MTINTAENVTAGAFGIYGRSVDGDMAITVASGTVEGTNITGIDALATGSGSTSIDIAADATVQGALFGLVTGSGIGAAPASVTNAGTIRDSEDDGAATTAGGDAFWSWTGSSVLENEGDLVGRVHTDGDAFTFNNRAGGEWYAGTGINPFDSADDTFYNEGTLFIREGTTTFAGLESFVNAAGGHTNLSYSMAATDTLNVVNLETGAGSLFSFDFDASGANNAGAGYDNSDDGLGTSDTIVVNGTANPVAGTQVAVNHINGDPAGLTGSVSLIYTGVNLDAPDPGASVTQSQFYEFAGSPDFAATAYYLVDDGNGGLYYQWAPNLTSATLGAYLGGDLNDSATADARIAGAGVSFAGVGGVGLSSGGVAPAIADRAAASDCQERFDAEGWVHTDGSLTSGDGFDGDSYGAAFGLERQIGGKVGPNCFGLVAGIFGGANKSTLSWGTGASDSSGITAGGYLRTVSATGFYANAIAAVSWTDEDLVNSLFGSTATRETVSYAGLGSVGYVSQLSPTSSIDWRAEVSYGIADSGAFIDSAGIEVDDTQSRIITGGVSVAYVHQFDNANRGFLKAGVKWTKAVQEVTAFGVAVEGTSQSTIGTVAAGLSSEFSERSSLDLAVHGTFTETSSSIGGSAGFKLAF